jgi:hypothetical protein
MDPTSEEAEIDYENIPCPKEFVIWEEGPTDEELNEIEKQEEDE